MGLITGILSETNEQSRKSLLKNTHPIYDANVTQWNIGLDAYDGSGGFLSGDYLWQFAREDSDQLKNRKEQARYHNYTETLVDIYVPHVLTGVTRDTNDAALAAWWDDVDGRGTQMDAYMASAFGQALSSGHAGVLVDKAAESPIGPAVADDPNAPFLRTFPNVAIRDWRTDGVGLAAVKLSEAAPTPDLAVPIGELEPGYLLWDRDMWARFNAKGEFLSGNEHDLGVVPLEVIRPKPSRRHPFIGKALIPASVVRALYNRASEEDLVLRDQAFSLFVVTLPIDAQQEDIDAIQRRLSQGVGTTTVAVIKGQADFHTADMAVPKTIGENQAALIHELYRMAHLRFQRDSLQAESADAIRLQRHDLDQTLKGMAQDLAQVEERLVKLYYGWTAADAEAAFDRADVSISYPSDFAIVNVEQELTAVAAAVSLDLGGTATKELKKRAVHLALPDLSDETLDTVRDEIEGAQEGVSSGVQSLRDQATERLRQAGVEVEAA